MDEEAEVGVEVEAGDILLLAPDREMGLVLLTAGGMGLAKQQLDLVHLQDRTAGTIHPPMVRQVDIILQWRAMRILNKRTVGVKAVMVVVKEVDMGDMYHHLLVIMGDINHLDQPMPRLNSNIPHLEIHMALHHSHMAKEPIRLVRLEEVITVKVSISLNHKDRVRVGMEGEVRRDHHTRVKVRVDDTRTFCMIFNYSHKQCI